MEALVAHGLANGYRCGASGEPCDDANRPYYRPNANITRGQLAKLIGGAANFGTIPPGQLFADVPPTNGFYGWVQQVGSEPDSVGPDYTQPFGVGAFLLAGAAMMDLTGAR